LDDGLPLQAVAHHLQVVQGLANRPPGLLAADLGGPFQPPRQDTELHLRADPMRPPRIEGTRLQPGGLQLPEAACAQGHAGVPEGHIVGIEGVVGGRHHERASILRFCRDRRGLTTQAAVCSHPEVAPEAARGHQLPGLLRVLGLPGVEGGQLRPHQRQELRPRSLLPRRLVGMVADPIAAAPLARADGDLLHPQVVGHVAVATCTREHVARHLGDRAHRHRQEVPAQGPAQPLPIGRGEPPASPDTDAAVQPPAPSVILEVVDGRHIRGVARQHPRAHRPSVAGQGQPDHHRGVALTAFLMRAARAQRGDLLVFPHVTGVIVVVDRAVAGRGLPADQVHSRVEPIGGAQEHLRLEGLEMAQQASQGAIEVLQCQGRGLGPRHLIGPPVRVAGQLRGRTGEPVGGHGQQGRLVGGVTAVLRYLVPAERADAELCPQGVSRLQDTRVKARLEVVDADIRRELAGRQIDAIVVGHAQDALGQSAQALRIDLVGAADRLNDTRLRAPSRLMVVIVGELVVDGVGTVLTSLSGRS
jgi:hypothetical protein